MSNIGMNERLTCLRTGKFSDWPRVICSKQILLVTVLRITLRLLIVGVSLFIVTSCGGGAGTNTGSHSSFFLHAGSQEIAVVGGGAGQVAFTSGSAGSEPPTYTIALSVKDLPSGTSAVVSPTTITPGQAFTLTISAGSNAPPAQNVKVSVTGTPSVDVGQVTTSILVDITQTAVTLSNLSDFTSTDATPYSAVYDPVHSSIFASNPSWNRVDVIDATAHHVVHSTLLPGPQGLDISQNNSTVWVSTSSQQVFAIDTATWNLTRYSLPRLQLSGNALQSWEGRSIFALSKGNFVIGLAQNSASATQSLALWVPSSNSLSLLTPPAAPGLLVRSRNGNRLYSISADSSGHSFYYDATNNSFSSGLQTSGQAVAAAASPDGSHVAICDRAGLKMYDANLNAIGALPGGTVNSLNHQGGMVFNRDGTRLYIVSNPSGIPEITTVNASTREIVRAAPAIPFFPENQQLQAPYLTVPIGVDSSGAVSGIQYFGIAFEDSTFAQKYVSGQPGTPANMQQISPSSGPLNGGTVSGGFGTVPLLTPSVWYGGTSGTANLDTSGGTFSVTSPQRNTSGPVSLKLLFPDGTEIFDPMAFSYGPVIQNIIDSGAAPQGGVTAELFGYGMPPDSSSGTLMLGGSFANITGLSAESASPFSNSSLTFTVPPGVPGWSDASVITSSGQHALGKAFFYANSVNDYNAPAPDTFSAILYDSANRQLYLSAGDHIDAFSTASNQYLSSITPPASGNARRFAGMSLNPNGLLLAADLLDGSLAVIDLATPGNSYAINVAAPQTGSSGCVSGPLYVAALANNQALVATGAMPSSTCAPGGAMYAVDLVAKTSVQVTSTASCPWLSSSANAVSYVAASGDGTKASIAGAGFCTYDASQNVFSANGISQPSDTAFSADGNVAATGWAFADSTANLVSSIAQPAFYFSAYAQDHPSTFTRLLQGRLSDSGSLYYVPYSNSFDIVDVQHGNIRMRFKLTEQVLNAVTPMAINGGGSQAYLLTDKGLTIVDLGEAPLSVGSVTPASASAGATLTLRGSGFDPNCSLIVGGMLLPYQFIDDSTIQFSVPNIPPGSTSVIMSGASGSYTLEGAFTVQ